MSHLRVDILLDAAAAAVERTNVSASSLTRVLRLLGKDDEKEDDVDLVEPFAILTAYRSTNSQEVNSTRLDQLDNILKQLGMKTYRLTGKWLEPPEGVEFEEAKHDKKLVEIREDSLFVTPKKQMDFADFEVKIIRQADRFQQDAIIMSDGVKLWIRTSSGQRHELGDRIAVHGLEDAYRRMRNQRKHPFVFAEVVES